MQTMPRQDMSRQEGIHDGIPRSTAARGHRVHTRKTVGHGVPATDQVFTGCVGAGGGVGCVGVLGVDVGGPDPPPQVAAARQTQIRAILRIPRASHRIGRTPGPGLAKNQRCQKEGTYGWGSAYASRSLYDLAVSAVIAVPGGAAPNHPDRPPMAALIG
jgi:hypothetical protein